eukprot:4863970-Amphidinium_carterae.1
MLYVTCPLGSLLWDLVIKHRTAAPKVAKVHLQYIPMDSGDLLRTSTQAIALCLGALQVPCITIASYWVMKQNGPNGHLDVLMHVTVFVSEATTVHLAQRSSNDSSLDLHTPSTSVQSSRVPFLCRRTVECQISLQTNRKGLLRKQWKARLGQVVSLLSSLDCIL